MPHGISPRLFHLNRATHSTGITACTHFIGMSEKMSKFAVIWGWNMIGLDDEELNEMG
jgi:hypothetical protein